MHALTLLSALALLGGVRPARAQTPQPAAAATYGVQFTCNSTQLQGIAADMAQYFRQLSIPAQLIQETIDKPRGTATYSLLGSRVGASTLYLAWRSDLAIADEEVQVPMKHEDTRLRRTVSKKEILLALLHPGRLTEFKGEACAVQALVDQVGIRQNTVMWAELLEWKWPNGGRALWNSRYWQQGTPQPGVPLHTALNDIFFQQSKYTLGCYAATKIVFAQGVLDYFRRVKRDAAITQELTQRLLADKEPLIDIEPGRMWSFEADFDPAERLRPGKILRLHDQVDRNNFIPGDWLYFLNTDPATYQKTGYEGSNAIYLGRNRFGDYYNDNVHHYSYKEKLDEVYHWRNGVFSRSRDYAKRSPLTAQDFERLSLPPERGGLLMPYRVVPFLFGFEPLPSLHPLTSQLHAPEPVRPAVPALLTVGLTGE